MAYDPTHPSAPSALTDSERALLEALPGGAAVFRVDGGLECRYYSESLAELSGRSAEELRTAMANSGSVRALVDPADWDRVRGQVLDKVSRGEPFSFSFHCLAPDGAPRWLHVNASRLREENGRPLYCFLLARPSQETELYRQLADDSPTAVLVVDKDTRRVQYANRAWKSMEGVPAGGSVAGRTLAEVTNRPRTFLTNEQRAGLTQDFQTFHIERSDGRSHRILIKIGDWCGTPVYIMHITDETESYLGQAKLQRLLDRLPGGVGICDLTAGEGRMRYLNDGFFRMLGLDAEERDVYSHQPLQTLANPEDWELLEKTYQSIMAGQDTADFNWRISLGNGAYRWVRMVCAAVERTGERCVLYVCFSDMDAEIRLRQELDYNRAMLDEAMKAEGLAVWQYDIQTHEIRLSEYAKRIFRPGVAPVDGSVTALSQSGLHPDDWEAYAAMAESLAAGRLPPPLVVRYHAPGSTEEWRWLRVTCTSILQKDGKPKTAMASALDVTDEVRAKQRYQEELSYRQALGQNLLSSHRVNLTKMEVEESHTLIRPEQTDPGQTVSAAFQQQVSLPHMPDPEERKAYMATFGFEKMLRDFDKGVRELTMDYRVRMPGGDVRWVCKKVKMMTNPYSGDVVAFMNTTDVNEAHIMKEIIDAVVSTEYDYIGMVDVARGTYVLFEHSSQSASMPPARGYLRMEVDKLVQDSVLLQDRERVIREMCLENVLNSLNKEDRYSVFYGMRDADGRTCRKKVQFQYLSADRDRLLITRMDVTDIDEAERKRNEALEAALEAARAATAAKSEFLARMSHEMRTPLNAIVGMAALGGDDVHDPAKAEADFQQITDAGHYLRGLINDILDVSRIESGKFDMQPQWNDVDEILQPVIDMITPLMAEKHIHFPAPVLRPRSDGMVLQVYMDKMRMQQVFINLLNNACKFTPEGGTVEWRMKHLSRTEETSSDMAIIRDNGCGMSEAFLRRIGEPFTQEVNPYSSGARGTGLGLYIVKKTCEAMGFELEVESALGQGTEFRVTTHFRYRLRPREEKRDAVAVPDLSGLRFLAAEDIRMNLKIIEQLLEKAGAAVDGTANGQACAERFAREPAGTYSGVLMDIQMPVMNGLEAARAIRALDKPDAKTVPIIAMTANAFPEDVKASLDAGMNDHLAKPIDPGTLYRAVEKVCLPCQSPPNGVY